MDWLPEQSKPGYYDLFQHEDGTTYVVLKGLTPSLIHEPSGIESFMIANYDSLVLMYWGAIIVTIIYLIGTYLVIPLYLRYKRGLAVFLKQ